MLDEGHALLGATANIDGFILACLVDASTGMVLASRKDHESIGASAVAAGAADIVNVLSMLAGEVQTDGLEDVMVTFGSQFYVIRPVRQESDPHILLLVILDRLRANLAMARREIRNFCANFAA
jgi:predicted regulator of Ras-like GTPase activity (Roadblock/LC7/MglB family)